MRNIFLIKIFSRDIFPIYTVIEVKEKFFRGTKMKSELILDNVSKSYKNNRALNKFTATMTDGIYALLGPNGAGKSTLMNILTDNLSRNGGTITFNGKSIDGMGAEYRNILGYMPQHQGMYKNFTVERFMQYMSVLKDVPVDISKTRIKNLLEDLELSEHSHKKIRALSGGMLRRLCLAQALINDPKILILDEPTAGLDPIQRINLRNYISKISNDKIVLIATHVVSDIEFIAKNIFIIKKGELIDNGTVQELNRKVDGKTWEVTVKTIEEIVEYQRQFSVCNIRYGDNGIILRIVSDEIPEPKAVSVMPTLEDFYLYTFEATGERK